MGERDGDREGRPVRQDALRRARRLVDAATIVEDELRFQVMRLGTHVKAKTDEENQYHADLKEGYGLAETYVRRLRRYHEGRIPKIESGESMSVVPDDDDPMSPYIDDGEKV
jgi:hypothetical protein